MNTFFRYITLFTFLFFGIFLKGQTSFEATITKTELGLDETFSITYTMQLPNRDYSIESIEYPSFADFNTISYSQQKSQSRTTTVSKSFTFQPIKKGTFKISKAKLTIDGKTFETKAFKIKITESSSSQKSTQNNSPNKTIQRGSILTNETSDDTKLLLTSDKSILYPGEQTLISLRFLSTDYNALQRIRESKQNRYKNFTTYDYPIVNNQIKEESYKGKSYYSLLVTQKIISPQLTGQLTIEPFQLEFPYLTEEKQRDFFGRIVNRYVWVKINSNKLIFDVKPLPNEGKPTNFSGAIGDFNLNSFIDKTEVKAGESIQYDLEISGRGDFKMITFPELKLSSDLEVYEPIQNEKTIPSKNGFKGKVKESFTIVPQYKANYTIPSSEFSYFNPDTEQYVTKTTPSQTIKVLSGPDKPKINSSITNSTKKEEADSTTLRNKIQPLTLQPLKKELHIYNPLFSENTLWLLIIGSLLLIPITLLLVFYFKKFKNNQQSKLSKISYENHLEEAKINLKQGNDDFYQSIEQALYTFINKRLGGNINTSNELQAFLKNKSISEEQISKIVHIISNCNQQKYSISKAENYSKDQILQDTLSFVKNFKTN